MDIKNHSTLPTGLVAYWKFDGNANDASGNGHTGTPTGGVTTSEVGKIEGCYDFDGADDFITFGTHVAYATNYASVSLWFRGDRTTPAFEDLLAKATPSTPQWVLGRFGSSTSPYTVTFAVNVGGTTLRADGILTDANVWHHLVGTYDGANIKIYCDGVLRGTTPHPGIIASAPTIPIYAGARNNGGSYSNPFDGKIDEIGLWSRALIQSEVTDLYQGGVGIPYESPAPGPTPTETKIYDGAFPFYRWGTPSLWHDGAFPMGTGQAMPRVVSAVALDSTHVRVNYDAEMKHASPSNPDDALNPSNYVFGVVGGVSISPVSVSLHQDSPTQVDILVNEMTEGASYTVTVSNVLSAGGSALDPAYAEASFAGVGVQPQVASASAVDSHTVEVVFSEAMSDTVNLRAATSYHISGPTTLTPSAVNVVDTTHVRVSVTEEMRNGGVYTITVGYPPPTGIYDQALNLLDPLNNDAAFTGIGLGPAVISPAVPKTMTEVWVTFSEAVEETSAEDITHYTIASSVPPSTLAVLVAEKINPTTVKLTTGAQTSGRAYVITVSTDVTDIAGNPVQAGACTANFTGLGYSPPNFEFNPADGALKVPVRDYLRVRIYDDTVDFTAIVRNTVWISVNYMISGVVQPPIYAVKNGVIQPGFIGRTEGNEAAPGGITFIVRPTEHWPERTPVTVTAYAEDAEFSANSENSDFTTDVYVCFEDDMPAFSALELKLSRPFLATHADAEKLRRLLFEVCSYSTKAQVRARTMMFLSSMTDMRTMLAGGRFTFAWVDDIKLCDRKPVTDVYKALRSYLNVAKAAALVVPGVSTAGKTLLTRYLASNSMIYVVNAVALTVVLTALGEV
jgi:hypothetical protein